MATRLGPTRRLEQAADQTWDVIVVGAGPAGALAARESARQGVSVLLVDKAVFPRRKICGCCVNAAALATLRAVGLGELATQLGAKPLDELWLASGRWRASIPLPGSVAVSREAFDAALVEQAVLAGADFLPHTLVTLGIGEGPTRRLRLCDGQQQVSVEARVVLAADGLSGRLLQHERAFGSSVAHDSRVGIGTMVNDPPRFYRSGTIFMVSEAGGYVGLVRLEDGRLNVAAALDPSFVRDSGGPGTAVAMILEQADLPPMVELVALPWLGTPPFTRHRPRLSAHRLFVLGDTAGYVEPFTGEGIAWALASGVAVMPLALKAVRHWTPMLTSHWMALHRRLLGRRYATCRVVTRLLRRVALTRAAVNVLSQAPGLAAPLVRYLNRPFPIARHVSEPECATS